MMKFHFGFGTLLLFDGLPFRSHKVVYNLIYIYTMHNYKTLLIFYE